ncbi:hypothetical protein N7495_005768 [Penicillium taxi]|uniref:uncharacterized protein n=1 Tax=Penicillium taxi TaxID=168475 RepID=UPI0025450ABA|nr:uncharacterized protein N7495_005768 [Penicillium taxi]KAJ5894077.1 hypothetical protein N7495_005768 [Penicillium taxi]
MAGAEQVTADGSTMIEHIEPLNSNNPIPKAIASTSKVIGRRKAAKGKGKAATKLPKSWKLVKRADGEVPKESRHAEMMLLYASLLATGQKNPDYAAVATILGISYHTAFQRWQRLERHLKQFVVENSGDVVHSGTSKKETKVTNEYNGKHDGDKSAKTQNTSRLKNETIISDEGMDKYDEELESEGGLSFREAALL